MTEIMNLQKLTQMALLHEADFEVFHGVTTHADERVRVQMVMSLKDCPDVRILFGDRKHGQRINSITLAKNEKINVKLPDLLQAIELNSASRYWTRSLMTAETPVFNMQPTGDGQVSITGRIQPDAFDSKTSWVTVDDEGISTLWDLVKVIVTNQSLVQGELVEGVPSVFSVIAPYSEEIAAKKGSGEEMTFAGQYHYPEIIRVKG